MYCFSILPRAGLGHKMFLWAYGAIFSSRNSLNHITIGWLTIHVGPVIRREKSYRFYFGYFKRNSLIIYLRYFVFKLFKKIKFLNLSEVYSTNNCFQNYAFENQHIDTSDPFKFLNNHRLFLKNKFFEILTPNILNRYDKLKSPIIGVHIRRGDFQKFISLKQFQSKTSVQTPLDFYINSIYKIRELLNLDVEVIVFSDGTREELSQLFKLKNIFLADENSDIIHFLQLSKSKIIIPSVGSGFSMWSSFFSDAVIIRSINDNTKNYRNKIDNSLYYEGILNENWKFNDLPNILKENLNSLRKCMIK